MRMRMGLMLAPEGIICTWNHAGVQVGVAWVETRLTCILRH